MSLVIKLTQGSWFRKIYMNTEKHDRFLEVINAPHIKKSIEFLDEEYTTIKLKSHHRIKIGRNSKNHIILDNDQVSAFHCEIGKHPLGHWYIRDLDSTMGTYLRRRGGIVKIEFGHFPLEKGDELLFARGGMVLSIE